MDLIIKNREAIWGYQKFRCSIGRNGITDDKVEGDEKTPIGKFPFLKAFYREDRLAKPQTQLPLAKITQQCGWCDDPQSSLYNQYIQKPFAASHENLWLEKPIYDLIIVIGHNTFPAIPGKGSAVFIHIASEGYGPTEGCIGLAREDLLKVFAKADLTSNLIVNS